MPDEPRRHPGFLIVLALTALATVPWFWIGRPVTLLAGIPLWLWGSVLGTLALSFVTAWGILRYWRDDDD